MSRSVVHPLPDLVLPVPPWCARAARLSVVCVGGRGVLQLEMLVIKVTAAAAAAIVMHPTLNRSIADTAPRLGAPYRSRVEGFEFARAPRSIWP